MSYSSCSSPSRRRLVSFIVIASFLSSSSRAFSLSQRPSHHRTTTTTTPLHSLAAPLDVPTSTDSSSSSSNPHRLLRADITRLGNLDVPSLGIGTISWSSDSLLSLQSRNLQDVVAAACQHNVALFDTAERYGSHLKTSVGFGWGETEEMLRLLLQQTTTKRPAIVATKFTPSPWRTTVQSVVDACEQSRRRLGVDQIDLYQLHMPDIVQPFRFLGQAKEKDEIYWDGLAECYHSGVVKNIGVCNYGPTLLMRCKEALDKRGVPLASNQIAYSLLGRHNGAQATLDFCKEHDIQVLAFYPLAMGLLTGKYTSSAIKGSSKKTALEERDLQRYARGDGKAVPVGGIAPLLTVMEAIAQERNKTVSQIALNYIICKGAIPIPGARTVAQVQDNAGALGWRLTEEEVQLLEATADSLGFGFDGAGFKRTSEKFVGYGVEKWSLD